MGWLTPAYKALEYPVVEDSSLKLQTLCLAEFNKNLINSPLNNTGGLQEKKNIKVSPLNFHLIE